eukprot:6195679-Pleurochrysis_carterae.AAC.1
MCSASDRRAASEVSVCNVEIECACDLKSAQERATRLNEAVHGRGGGGEGSSQRRMNKLSDT